MTSCDAPWEERQQAYLDRKIRKTQVAINVSLSNPDRRKELEERLRDLQGLRSKTRKLPDPVIRPTGECEWCNETRPLEIHESHEQGKDEKGNPTIEIGVTPMICDRCWTRQERARKSIGRRFLGRLG